MFDVPLHLSFAGLRFPDRPALAPRDLIDRVGALRLLHGVVLDAAAPTLRPRELDRSARRDLAAVLRRSNLAFGGLDLWIPPEHFSQSMHADRAIAAVLAACDMASELARLLDAPASARVNLELPETRHPDVERTLLRTDLPAHLADHRRPPATAASVVPGIDPAAFLLAGEDPVTALTRAAGKTPTARFSDASSVGRTTPGAGRLDVAAYKLAAAAAGVPAAVLDLRGVDDASKAIEKAAQTWGRFHQ